MERERGDEIDAVLHAVRGAAGRNNLAAVRVDRETERLGRQLVLAFIEVEGVVGRRRTARANGREIPAAEDAGRRIDVGLDVVLDAESKELHELAPKVLLRLG